jgi:hypothetical protein
MEPKTGVTSAKEIIEAAEMKLKMTVRGVPDQNKFELKIHEKV